MPTPRLKACLKLLGRCPARDAATDRAAADEVNLRAASALSRVATAPDVLTGATPIALTNHDRKPDASSRRSTTTSPTSCSTMAGSSPSADPRGGRTLASSTPAGPARASRRRRLPHAHGEHVRRLRPPATLRVGTRPPPSAAPRRSSTSRSSARTRACCDAIERAQGKAQDTGRDRLRLSRHPDPCRRSRRWPTCSTRSATKV